jgi:hypothetical protein
LKRLKADELIGGKTAIEFEKNTLAIMFFQMIKVDR